jgi:hypothetical protein
MTAVLTNNEWNAIVAVIPTGNDLERARRELEECIADYRGLCLPRAKLLEKRKKWQRVEALVTDELGADLIQSRVRARVEGYGMLARSVKGKCDPARDWLYWRLMAIWSNSLGGTLTVSVPSQGGDPGGPLIRFLVAAVGIAVGKAPNAHTLRTVIRRERRHRQGRRANQPPKNSF